MFWWAKCNHFVGGELTPEKWSSQVELRRSRVIFVDAVGISAEGGCAYGAEPTPFDIKTEVVDAVGISTEGGCAYGAEPCYVDAVGIEPTTSAL